MSTPTLTIANAHDEPAWRTLWAGFQAHYNLDLPESTTAATWARIIDPGHRMSCVLAWQGGQAQGFALYHHHCSSWVPGDDLYLEDMFVAPEARGQGMGRALIEQLIEIGRRNGWHRLYWNTEITNAAARRLYDRFCQHDGHIRYRLKL